MKYCLALMAIAVMYHTTAEAQNEIDALRYSQTTFGGSGRVLGMGGAFGALGGDVSSMQINPAGIGIFRKSEVSLTPAFHQFNATSVYEGYTKATDKSNLNFSSAGAVFTNIDKSKEFGWIATNFGFAYNRIDNYHVELEAEGPNAYSSLLDTYLNKVNDGAGITPELMADEYPLTAYMAFYTYLLDTIPGDPTHYFSQIPYAGILQNRKLTSNGSHSETQLSFGANHSNKFYIGATIGFPRFRYTEMLDYSEKDHKDTIPAFTSFNIGQELYSTGQGMNGKFGIIYRPHDMVRLGLAYQTPTLYTINEEFYYTVEALYDNGFNPDSTVAGLFKYSIRTPSRTTASVGLVVYKAGLINVDVEQVNYGGAKLSSSVYGFDSENKNVKDKYQSATNIRVGTEWRINPFRLRAGYAYYGNPFKPDVANNGSHESISLGGGIRGNGYYLDLAYVFTQSQSNTYFYKLDGLSPVEQHMRSHIFAVTVGFRY
ncbi:MAG: hypothetical protein KDD36_11425 [Flavobacteriales bacterium]|nr:hypothetical protein [Flavobacteriales bacterium]